jgi:hypothetical protein
VDDRTDDCAFGAMMSLAVRLTFRKLRFQMIADIHNHGIGRDEAKQIGMQVEFIDGARRQGLAAFLRL